MILPVIAISVVLRVITASKGSCELPTKGQHLHYNVSSNPNFKLWLKMEEEYTRLDVTVEAMVDNNLLRISSSQWNILSNTEEYIGFYDGSFKTLYQLPWRVVVITGVTISSNASMAWVYCNGYNRFPDLLTSSNTEAVTVLVVLVVVLLVVLTAAIAYIHHLRKTLTQVVVSQFIYNKYTSDDSSLSVPSSRRKSSVKDNIYEEWQERPPVAGASRHSSTNSIYGGVVNLPEHQQLSNDGKPAIQLDQLARYSKNSKVGHQVQQEQ